MIRKKRLLILIVVLFIITAAFAGTAAALSGPSLALTFDGYSDGLNMRSFGSFVKGAHCGSNTAEVWGVKTYNWGIAHLAHDPAGPMADVHTVVRYDGEWANFTPAGLLNQGTWSFGCPISKSLPPSTTASSDSVNVGEMVMAVDISFDGYCDGLSVTVSGSNRDAAFFVEGSRCGCAEGEVFGSRWVGRTAVQRTVASGGADVMYVIDDNGQWRSFTETGLLGSGTWSFGCPAPLPGLPSTTDN